MENKLASFVAALIFVSSILLVGSRFDSGGISGAAGSSSYTYTKSVMLYASEMDTTISILVSDTINAPDPVAPGITGYGGPTGIYPHVLAFDNTVDEQVSFVFTAPSDIDDSQNVTASILWIPDNAWSSGSYQWRIRYFAMEPDGARAAGSTTIITATKTPENDTNFRVDDIGTAIDLNDGQTLYCTLWRDPDNDTGNADGWVYAIRFTYTAFQVPE